MTGMCAESEAVSATAAGAKNGGALPDRPRRVLIADDEHLVASGLAASLKTLGFEVVGPVADGAAAIRKCREDKPDLALLDIRMPGTDGIEAAAVLFSQMQVPVVIFSAYSGTAEIKRCEGVGIFGYLLKPVTQDQLRVGISVAWDRYRAHMELDNETAKLRKRLDERKIIEQAKWVLVKRKSIDEPEAMRLLQQQARNTRRTLADVAQSVLENDTLFNAE